MFGSVINHVGHNYYALVSSAGIDLYLLEKQVDTGGTRVKNTLHSIKIRILFCKPHRSQRAYDGTYGCTVKLFLLETMGNFVLVLCVLGFVT